ncbi:hypothetical protein DACRYDRAFT_119189 [Dacryopinax primogenitus]|uniref:Uncharacterized protein n=1 Tax=Dacryopinax primogenitus (strain DJM 731) TaxID=1858805 RepID=M5FQ24_DACPD|nr:uncharacterized protein DACRYDRAFT_119189 [Dacryopinax primogenitus]EJT97488.1 hypothetical protein DACRYDRAFT_119189 [Dacryopinax primogenitus]
MTTFLSSILPTGLRIPSLPNPIAFLTRQEEEQPPEPQRQPQPDTNVQNQPSEIHPHTDDHVEHAVSDTELHEDLGTRRRRQPNETFIIVRPPPAKNNHPLNLQIQLIPPNLQKQQRRSVELSRDDIQSPVTPDSAGSTLTRRTSIRSDRSASLYSFASSSVTSLSSTSSGRRVIPLYNLSAHNVIQNTVLDAGTDAKVAKFMKKGLEVMQVVYIEPVEFWEHSHHLLDHRGTRLSDNSHITNTESAGDRTPRTSFSHDKYPYPAPPITPRAERLAPPQPEQKKQKRPFGNLFKRRNGSISELSAVQQPPPSPARTETMPTSPSITTSEERLLAPTLGLQPTQGSKMAAHNHNRAISYVWVVRKWLKPTGENWLNKGLNNLRMGGLNQADPMADIELRFEWTKAGDHRQGGRRRSVTEAESATPSARNSIVAPHATSLAPPNLERCPAPSFKRRSVSPRSSAAALHVPPAPTSIETSSTNSQSDPEDDDTPWTCTLHVSPTQAKMRVAALIPAPHHPKLLGQVKIPFPLPDVAVDRGEFLPRVDGVDNVEEAGLLLTAEDIKDIIASTCLWLVVRESFGGIDKKRKGDGWRLRS